MRERAKGLAHLLDTSYPVVNLPLTFPFSVASPCPTRSHRFSGPRSNSLVILSHSSPTLPSS